MVQDKSSKSNVKEKLGIVVSDNMDKTVVVKSERTYRHPLYKKVIRSSRKYHAHDEGNVSKKGDTVRIVESRPLSKLKRWKLVEVVKKASA
ncbi:MAG: 30S ribosomal protein S17 [Candidatus Ancaeobacter aquaticus]|nr:30S ribosomal protein S17 [Candidatus Ancaeobacter aquaticus]